MFLYRGMKWPRLSRQKMGVNKVDCGYLFQDVFKGGDVGGERGEKGGYSPLLPPVPSYPINASVRLAAST